MGKKRKFNRFIRWIRSDLPEDNKSVLLLGVTKIPSPTLAPRARPHTLHLDHHLAAKSHTLHLDHHLATKAQTLHFDHHLAANSHILHLDHHLTANSHTLHLDYHLAAKSHTLHFDHHLAAKSHTLDSLPPHPRHKPRPTRTWSDDSLGYAGPEIGFANCNFLASDESGPIADVVRIGPKTAPSRYSKRVSFEADGLRDRSAGFRTDTPLGWYHADACAKVVSEVDCATEVPGVMDKSVDSIGSCSLDVDASSTDFSDSSIESSNCTLRSLGLPTPNKEKTVPSFYIQTSPTTDVEAKKPSYLNLACTVNGYSNITNYDSKLRENFRTPRSREVSPIRPQDYHVIIDPLSSQNSETSRFLTTNYSKPLLSSPSKMANSNSQTVLQSGYSYASSTNRTVSFVSKETRNFTKSMLYDSDTVDACLDKSRTNGVQNKFTSYETSKVSHCSYVNVNGQKKSFSETAVQENVHTNGQNNGEKSFIQQRVERLYGPAALAQGFFISKRMKNRLSESENSESTPQIERPVQSHEKTVLDTIDSQLSLKQSCSSPSLPVLRHLRPEFRAQLPILSPKKVNVDNTIHKSTTVPCSLTTVANGFENGMKPLQNGSKSIEQIENKENIQKQIIMGKALGLESDVPKKELITSNKIITEEIPAAPQVILPIPKSEAMNGNDLNGNISEVSLNGVDVNCKFEVKDGHYFLKILKNETDRLGVLAEKIEAEMERQLTILNDEVLGYLRSASGKARLLVSQKMQQFEGLCHKNINQIPGEPFPTTAEDLQGFWDMVMLQVIQIDQIFAEVDALKANNWVIVEKSKPETNDVPKSKKIIVVKKTVSANAEAQRKQREAARKKMIEERRKMMREKQLQEKGIEIFVPESS